MKQIKYIFKKRDTKETKQKNTIIVKTKNHPKYLTMMENGKLCLESERLSLSAWQLSHQTSAFGDITTCSGMRNLQWPNQWNSISKRQLNFFLGCYWSQLTVASSPHCLFVPVFSPMPYWCRFTAALRSHFLSGHKSLSFTASAHPGSSCSTNPSLPPPHHTLPLPSCLPSFRPSSSRPSLV